MGVSENTGNSHNGPFDVRKTMINAISGFLVTPFEVLELCFMLLFQLEKPGSEDGWVCVIHTFVRETIFGLAKIYMIYACDPFQGSCKLQSLLLQVAIRVLDGYTTWQSNLSMENSHFAQRQSKQKGIGMVHFPLVRCT